MLSRIQNNALERPLGFSSGRFRDSQVKWPIKEKEMYAFVSGLEIFHINLYLRLLRWWTNNRSLAYLTSESVIKKDRKRLNQKVLRWLDFISLYNFEIEHHSGKSASMLTADALSRYPNNVYSITPELRSIKSPFWVENTFTIGELVQAQEDDPELKNNKPPWKFFYTT